jgi:two-component sensor histidine kinase
MEWLSRWVAILGLPDDPRTLALLEWCADGRLGGVLQVTNLLIGAAYLSIPTVIVAYLRRRPEVESKWVFWCFALFILGCGATHFAHVLLLQDPAFWYVPTIMAHVFTAGISVATAIALWPLLPKLAAIPTPSEYEAVVVQLKEHRKNLFRDKDMLLRELNHRVRNNLQIVEGSLRLQAQQADRGCEDALNIALGRVRAISRVHERIYVEDTDKAVQVETSGFIEGLCAELASQFDADIDTDVDPLHVSVDESVPIAMIVNELVTNAVKYGRRPGQRAHVRVSLKARPGHGGWELAVSDRGPGVDPDAAGGRSLGMRLIRSLAQQLDGELVIESSDGGATFRVLGRRYAAEHAA